MKAFKELILNSFVNLSLRSSSVLLKFILIIFISKEFSVEDLGVYNIFASAIAIFLFIAGFEFHYFNTKEIINRGIKDATNIFFNQLLFISFWTVIALIFSYFLIFGEFLSKEYFLLFSLVLYFDLLSQELSRLLIAFFRSVSYNIIFFIKSGLWVLIVIFFSTNNEIDLNFIFTSWLFGNVLALVVAIYYCFKFNIFSVKVPRFDFNYIKQGIIYAVPFLFSVIIMRLINFADRFFIDHFLGKEEVGIYAFFVGIAAVPTTLVSSGISVQFTPKFLENYKNGDKMNFIKNLKTNLTLIILLFLTFEILAFFSINYLLEFIDREVLSKNNHLLHYAILAQFFLGLSTVTNTILFCFNKKTMILISAVVSLLSLVVGQILLTTNYGLFGAVTTIIISYLLLLIFQIYFASVNLIQWLKQK